MSTERARALRELADTMEERRRVLAELARLDAVRDRRIMRAVALGGTRPEVGEIAELSRQRVQQITTGIERGETSRAEVRELAKRATPNGRGHARGGAGA